MTIVKSELRTTFRQNMRQPILLIVLLLVTCCSCKKDRGTLPQNDTGFYASVKIREIPFKNVIHKRPLLELTEQEKELIWGFVTLPKDEELGLSAIFHYLKVYAEKQDKYQNEIDRLLSIIQQDEMGKTVLGDAVFRTSKFGVAPIVGRTKRSQEAHRDQGIAELGLLGTPSSYEIEIDGKKYYFSDAVRECVANFYLHEKELAWSAIALVLYLPPQSEWTNRYGERCNFDQLVDELMKRRFEDNSCAGAHLLESLTLIYKVSLDDRILSPEKQRELGKWLHIIFDTLLQGQHEAGYWRLDWFTSIPGYEQPFKDKHKWTPPDDPEGRLLATCHIVEWMLVLPDEFDVSGETLEKAGRWMIGHLKTKKPEDFTPACPYAHVVRDLELLSTVEGDH